MIHLLSSEKKIRRDNKAIKIKIAPTKIKNLLMPEIGIKIPPFPC
jgi:hypothetical protein